MVCTCTQSLEVRGKVIADVVEALIGSFYVAGGEPLAMAFLVHNGILPGIPPLDSVLTAPGKHVTRLGTSHAPQCAADDLCLVQCFSPWNARRVSAEQEFLLAQGNLAVQAFTESPGMHHASRSHEVLQHLCVREHRPLASLQEMHTQLPSLFLKYHSTRVIMAIV